jgi:hypothetical protein
MGASQSGGGGGHSTFLERGTANSRDYRSLTLDVLPPILGDATWRFFKLTTRAGKRPLPFVVEVHAQSSSRHKATIVLLHICWLVDG